MKPGTDPTPDSVVLSTGARLPRVGLGVFRSPTGGVTRAVVRQALALGYRHIDTAKIYGNETEVGAALSDSGLERSQVFVTTKLWNEDQGYDAALSAFDGSLRRLGLEYVDLFLLHFPVPGKRLDSWRALERLADEGRARAIGVSNFMTHHLEELLRVARTPPSVNQIEVSPFLQQQPVRKMCRRHGIAVEAYSPLTKGRRLTHPTVLQIAQQAQATPAQVLLRWGLDQGLVVLPKTTQPARLAENWAAQTVSLSADQRAALDALEEGLVTGWDPRQVE